MFNIKFYEIIDQYDSRNVLLMHWGRDGVSVVPHNEDGLRIERRREIERYLFVVEKRPAFHLCSAMR